MKNEKKIDCTYCDNKGTVPLLGAGSTGIVKPCPICKGNSKKK